MRGSVGMRLIVASSLVLLSCVPCVMADPIPYDPHILLASGGDAQDLGLAPINIDLSTPANDPMGNKGGGIFVFHNATGMDLTKIEVDLAIPDSFANNGFQVINTIFVMP